MFIGYETFWRIKRQDWCKDTGLKLEVLISVGYRKRACDTDTKCAVSTIRLKPTDLVYGQHPNEI